MRGSFLNVRPNIPGMFHQCYRAHCDVTAPAARLHCVWQGGSIVATSLSDEDWISMQEYNEMGLNVVHRKCVTYTIFTLSLLPLQHLQCRHLISVLNAWVVRE